jgi:hypothetical protein
MAKRKGKSGNGEGHYIITQANLDKKGKTNKKLKGNPMAMKYLSVKGKELKEAGEAAYKANMAKHREKMNLAS